MNSTQTPSDDTIMALAENLAYEMSSAATVYKYAQDLVAAGHAPDVVERALLSRLSPEHIDLLRDLHGEPAK